MSLRRHMIAFSQLNPALNKLYENNQEISALNGFRNAYMHVRASTLEAPGHPTMVFLISHNGRGIHCKSGRYV